MRKGAEMTMGIGKKRDEVGFGEESARVVNHIAMLSLGLAGEAASAASAAAAAAVRQNGESRRPMGKPAFWRETQRWEEPKG